MISVFFLFCTGVSHTACPVVVPAEELRSCNGTFDITVPPTVTSTYNATNNVVFTNGSVGVPAGWASGIVPGEARVFVFEGANVLCRFKIKNTSGKGELIDLKNNTQMADFGGFRLAHRFQQLYSAEVQFSL